ncbi:hypothetical protein OF83DRAFT_792022 [Amylostereum chailletii]|nr:hypothetical protein OF83DRAFT_792022 [Amylostereum chailletii]
MCTGQVSFVPRPIHPSMTKATYAQLDGGLVWLRLNFPGFVLETTLFGIFTLLITLSTCVLVRKGLSSRTVRAMLAVTLVMYICSTTYWVLDMYPFITVLRDPARHGIERASESFARGFVSAVCLGMNLLLSDAVVMWRAWVLWGRSRLVFLSSCVLFLSTFVLMIVTGCVSKNPPSSDLITGDEFGFPVEKFGLATLSLSLASNVWTTVMIGYKAWYYRRSIGAHLCEGGGKGRVEKILTLLVESGVIYCCIWAVYIASNATPALQGTFAIFIEDGVPPFSGIYPTIIIVIVCLQKSHCESQFTYASSTPTSLGRTETAVELSSMTRNSVLVISNTKVSMDSVSMDNLEKGGRSERKIPV